MKGQPNDYSNSLLAREPSPTLLQRQHSQPVGVELTMLHWALAVVGLTTIITQSTLFAPLRQVFAKLTGSKFLGCPMCVGFWVGFWLSAWCGLTLPNMVIDGWASSGICWITYVVLVRLGSKEL